jgi:hypothetical protein
MQNRLQAKVVAAETPEKLEKGINDFLAQENVVFEDLKFAMDGTDLSYNVVIMYKKI